MIWFQVRDVENVMLLVETRFRSNKLIAHLFFDIQLHHVINGHDIWNMIKINYWLSRSEYNITHLQS